MGGPISASGSLWGEAAPFHWQGLLILGHSNINHLIQPDSQTQNKALTPGFRKPIKLEPATPPPIPPTRACREAAASHHPSIRIVRQREGHPHVRCSGYESRAVRVANRWQDVDVDLFQPLARNHLAALQSGSLLFGVGTQIFRTRIVGYFETKLSHEH